MASETDTLNLGSIGPHRDQHNYPGAIHVPQRADDPVIHPDAAAAARQRIAAIAEPQPFIKSEEVPAAPTADLITNKTALAHHTSAKPQVGHAKVKHDGTAERRQLPSIIQPLLTAVGIFLLTLLLFKAPIILSQLQYNFGNKPSNATTASTNSANTPVSSSAMLSIPKINVQAPVEYINTVDETAIETALQNGVIHYSTTALPGQNGNVALFGHSSNDWWQPGNYKFVFVLLDKLSPGDPVYLDYNGVRYTYQVTGSQVVQPTDMAVLNPTPTPTLSLITCTPPGTSLQRLVVSAKQVSPDPNANHQASPSASPQSQQASLPSAAPSFTTQVANAWNSLAQSVKSLFGGGTTTPNSGNGSTSGQSQLPATQ